MEQQTDEGLARTAEAVEPDAASTIPTSSTNRSWRPADYYASPPPKARFPRWVPIAGGVAAIFTLVLMVAVAMFLQSGGLASFVALAIGQFQGELKQMTTEDVQPEAASRLDASLKQVRERLAAGDLDQSLVLPLLQELEKVAKDRKVTPDEVEALQSVVDEIVGSDQPAQPVEL